MKPLIFFRNLFCKLSILKIASLLLMLELSLLTGCASIPDLTSRHESAQKLFKKTTNQKVFFYPFDNVWRATLLTIKYPLTNSNIDTGMIETEFVKGIEGWQPPVNNETPSSGLQYKLNLSLVKGMINSKETVKVTLTKKIEVKRDFFSEPKPLETDGLEEMVLFYRIERELIIEEAIKKLAAQQQVTPNE